MKIRELCYELYKIDWMRRISADRIADSLKEFYQDCNDISDYSYEDFINENGYNGDLYVCYDEFLGAEYTDEEYMRGLLDNDMLFAEYVQDFHDMYLDEFEEGLDDDESAYDIYDDDADAMYNDDDE